MRNYLIAASLSLALAQSAAAQAPSLPPGNPFAQPSTLPYGAPPFDRIRNTDFEPALDAGLSTRLIEVSRIAENPAPPTFENTLVALQKAGVLLTRVLNVFGAVAAANTNDTLQKLQESFAAKYSANRDAILLNPKLFARVKAVYDKRKTLKLDAESQRLLEVTYKNFVLSGANISGPGRERFQALNKEEASLGARFSNLLVNAVKNGAFIVSREEDLAGLSENEKATYAANAKARGFDGKWLLPLKNTTQQPALPNLAKREVRKALFDASWNRAERGDSNDTRAVVLRLAAIRAEKAKLLGFPSFAAWKLQDQMARTPEAVDAFFARLVPLLKKKSLQEAAEIQQQINAQKGGFQLASWDWDRYAEQVRKAKYDLDESEVKPYFELNTVLEKGVFHAANLLYGITFKERHDLPVYQSDVRVWEVFDHNGQPMALFYGDYYKRDNKSGGAWMNNFVDQSTLLGTKPVITNVCNFDKPAPGQPALISFDDVRTMFHEFGHALHGLFASQKYIDLSGTNTARDFVEFPSQFNEHWALDPAVLKNYARHYKTGERIPQPIVDKIKRSATFNQGYVFTEAIEAALLDMSWHKLAPGQKVSDVDAFEKAALHSTGLDLPQVPPRYRSSYFLHIWGSSYAAGYYAYQWTKMLSEDAFVWFEEHGGLTRANGDRFRKLVLSRGNSQDYGTMYRAFRGKDPDIRPMQALLGIK
ncbi:peptidyl-dipeptidase Dcp [Flaviaesturariibacter amylovorans]|uniref:Peptidyl-dipeptidase Dcp n=1 Tax=Flaviaesturariibacter amylovorans TaxID=1084520 RepID=A0ABP8HG95_9BACT